MSCASAAHQAAPKLSTDNQPAELWPRIWVLCSSPLTPQCQCAKTMTTEVEQVSRPETHLSGHLTGYQGETKFSPYFSLRTCSLSRRAPLPSFPCLLGTASIFFPRTASLMHRFQWSVGQTSMQWGKAPLGRQPGELHLSKFSPYYRAG